MEKDKSYRELKLTQSEIQSVKVIIPFINM